MLGHRRLCVAARICMRDCRSGVRTRIGQRAEVEACSVLLFYRGRREDLSGGVGVTPAETLKLIDEGAIADAYFAVCDRHPLRHQKPEPMPSRDILRRAKGLIGLEKLSEPGRTLLIVTDAPANLGLEFILTQSCVVEARIEGELLQNGRGFGLGSFRLFCHEAKGWAQPTGPDRPYRDPCVYSIDELLAVLLQIREITLQIVRALTGQPTEANAPPWSELPPSIRAWIPATH